jgi:hypothetical protein
MILKLTDPRVNAAIVYLKQKHNIVSATDHNNFVEIFENEYHCKIILDDHGVHGGTMYIPDEKYQSWFVLKFEDSIS